MEVHRVSETNETNEINEVSNHRRSATKQQRSLMMIMQDFKCKGCGDDLNKYEADHIKEWSKGGKTETENLQLLCIPCHREKTRLFLEKDNKI